jgi:putative DNA primase/helicase
MNLPAVEPWEEPVDGSGLLDELAATVRRFLVLPKWAAETLALWILHTYAFRLRDVTAYLGIESPEKRCGKTTLLTVLSELTNRAVVAANISSPAFFRVIEETQPTLLMDEADTSLRGNDELRGILNSGYTRKTAFVVRVAGGEWEGGGARDEGSPDSQNGKHSAAQGREQRENGKRRGSRLARFSCWCPKALAAIGRLPDTLADRCIVIRMQRKLPHETCERLRELEPEKLRRRCARFVGDHVVEIASARPEMPAGLNDRAADIWEPLMVLADLAGGQWPQAAREAALSLSTSAQESSPIGALLLDILLVFARAREDRIWSRRLVAELNGFGGRPWAEIRKGKEATELWLAQRLRPYGIRPKSLWIEGVSSKGYEMEDFREVFRRYIPRSELEALRAEAEEGAGENQMGGGV